MRGRGPLSGAANPTCPAHVSWPERLSGIWADSPAASASERGTGHSCWPHQEAGGETARGLLQAPAPGAAVLSRPHVS